MSSTAEMNPKRQTEEGAYMFAMHILGSSFLPMVLMSAIQLDLLETIARAGPDAYVSPSQLADQLPSSQHSTPVMLDRILRFLASYSVLNCRIHESKDGHFERLYALAPVCKFFTKSSDGVSLVPYLLMSYDKIFIETWYYLTDAVLDGGTPSGKERTENEFAALIKDAGFTSYNKACRGYNIWVMELYK